MAGGRPTDYKPEYAEQAYKLCLMGMTDKNLADFFEVSEQTVNAWKGKHPKFLESLRSGKVIADGNVAQSLYNRANGSSHIVENVVFNDGKPEVITTMKYYPPDTTACRSWLNNRQKEYWREKVEVENTGEIAVKHGGLSRAQRILEEITGLGSDPSVKDPVPD